MGADEQGRLTEMLFGAHLGHAVAVIAEIGVADLIGWSWKRVVIRGRCIG